MDSGAACCTQTPLAKALLPKQGGAAVMQAAAGSDCLAGLKHSQRLALNTIDKGKKMPATGSVPPN